MRIIRLDQLTTDALKALSKEIDAEIIYRAHQNLTKMVVAIMNLPPDQYKPQPLYPKEVFPDKGVVVAEGIPDPDKKEDFTKTWNEAPPEPSEQDFNREWEKEARENSAHGFTEGSEIRISGGNDE